MTSEFEKLFAGHSEPLAKVFGQRFLFVPSPAANDDQTAFEIFGDLIRIYSNDAMDGRNDGGNTFRTQIHNEQIVISVLIAEFPARVPASGDMFKKVGGGQCYKITDVKLTDDGWLDCFVRIMGGDNDVDRPNVGPLSGEISF